MRKILISACLLGDAVRYDGNSVPLRNSLLDSWVAEGRLVKVCPEVEGGLSVPRPPAEIRQRRVITAAGDDISEAFVAGAYHALELCRQHGIRTAILKERSPSCGSAFVYDGSFSGQLIRGQGVCAALLRQNGIRVFSEDQLEEVAEFLVENEEM